MNARRLRGTQRTRDAAPEMGLEEASGADVLTSGVRHRRGLAPDYPWNCLLNRMSAGADSKSWPITPSNGSSASVRAAKGE